MVLKTRGCAKQSKNVFSPFTFHFSPSFAFTLSEILITLGIIGVLAAMTIPTLLANIEESQRVVALKKVHSTLSNAANTLISDNGGTPKDICSSNDNACIRDKFLEYLSYTKKCTNTCNDCFVRPKQYGGTWVDLDGSSPAVGTDASAVLNDGTFVHFWQASGNCSNNSYNAYNVYNLCTRIIVDINGFKKPNITGKDIFLFGLTVNGIKPFGYGTTCGGTGWNCSSYYLLR